jgi:hypothetical protein
MSTPFNQSMHLTDLGVELFIDGNLNHTVLETLPTGEVKMLVHGELHVVFQKPLPDGTILGRMELCAEGEVQPIMHICRFEIGALDETRLHVAGLPGLVLKFHQE